MHAIVPFWIKTRSPEGLREFSLDELPRCTSTLVYSQDSQPGSGELHGIFRFDRRDLGLALLEHLKSNAVDGRVTTRDQGLLDWFRNYDKESTTVTALPFAWEGIESVLLSGIIVPGKFTVTCHACDKKYESHEVQVIPNEPKARRRYDTRTCPSGHVLSRILTLCLC